MRDEVPGPFWIDGLDRNPSPKLPRRPPMLKLMTILAIVAMGFCTLIVFAALFSGTYFKIREAASRRSPQSGV